MSSDWAADVVIAGAGAAGLWAAARAARLGVDVLVLEKTPRTGTKILASGGSRCNLTTTLGSEGAALLFGKRPARFLRHAFGVLTPEAVRERFAAWGVPTVEAPLEKIFPASQSARDVRDALEREARDAGVRFALEVSVQGVEPVQGSGPSSPELSNREPSNPERWRLVTDGGRAAEGRFAFLCTGGSSYPRTGTRGEGYAWLEALGLPLVHRAPALVPLTSPAPWVRELTGIAWASGEVRLHEQPSGRILTRRRRPLLFTHAGVSGPAAMDVSRWVSTQCFARAEAPRGISGSSTDPPFLLTLDLFPDLPHEELRRLLIGGAAAKGAPRLTRVLPERLPKRLALAITEAAGLDPDPPVVELSKAGRHALVEALKALPIPVDGVLGYDKAEVTKGGLELSAVDPRSMRVNAQPGLYVFGELLDLDGPIGGLNFQAAFACAEVAALDAARRLTSP